jgi:hypothetical protein
MTSVTKHYAYQITGQYVLSIPFEIEVFATNEQMARDYVAGEMAGEIDCAAPHTVTETLIETVNGGEPS